MLYSVSRRYISYFFVAVIKHHDQDDLQEKGYLGFWFQKVKSPLGSMAGTTHSSSIWNNKLRAYILNHKQESEKEETRKTNTPPPHTSSSKATPSKSTLTVPPIGDQVFKFLSL